MSSDPSNGFDSLSQGELNESDNVDIEDEGQVVCARCKQSSPEDDLDSMPSWLAVAFRVFLPAGHDELEALYCPPCRAYLIRIMAFIVFMFGGVVVLAAIVNVTKYLGWI